MPAEFDAGCTNWSQVSKKVVEEWIFLASAGKPENVDLGSVGGDRGLITERGNASNQAPNQNNATGVEATKGRCIRAAYSVVSPGRAPPGRRCVLPTFKELLLGRISRRRFA